MYILASVFFKKTKNLYLKLEIRVVWREFLKQNRWLFLFVHQKSWKLAFKTGFFGTQFSFVFVLAGRGN